MALKKNQNIALTSRLWKSRSRMETADTSKMPRYFIKLSSTILFLIHIIARWFRSRQSLGTANIVKIKVKGNFDFKCALFIIFWNETKIRIWKTNYAWYASWQTLFFGLSRQIKNSRFTEVSIWWWFLCDENTIFVLENGVFNYIKVLWNNHICQQIDDVAF